MLKAQIPGLPLTPPQYPWESRCREHRGCRFCYTLVLLIHPLDLGLQLSLPPAMPQTTEHLLQGLPDWLTSDRGQHPMADFLSASAQAWQPCRPTAMTREAGGILHLWRILLAAVAATSTCASAKTSCPAQGVFRARNGKSTAKKQMSVNHAPGRLYPKAFFRV